MDNWIVKNVSLQNDSLNNVINVIKNCLENKILIDKKNDIDPIEMDDFEKSGSEENKFTNIKYFEKRFRNSYSNQII